MNKLACLLSLICILVFSSCEEDKVYYHTAAKADFTIGEDMYELGQTTDFKDASVPDEGNKIVSWLWEFGDAEKSISTQQNPSFVYQSDGTFTIKLTVTDNNGLSATAKKDLTILDPAKAINIMWQKEMGGPIESTVSPALSADGKTVYMITDQTATGAFDVKLFAYDTTNGTQKWAFDVTAKMNELNPGGGASMVYASPAVGPNGDVYITVRDLKPANAGHPRALFLFAVKSNGSLNWAYKAADSNLYAVTPAIDASGNIYFGHRGKKLIVLNAAGDVLKEISLDVEVLSGLSLSKDGSIYFGSSGKNGYFGYDYATGSQKFIYQKDLGSTALKGNSYSIGADGTIYTVAELTTGGAVIALNSDGTEKWIYKTPGAIINGGVTIGTDGTLYANGGKAVTGENSAGLIALNTDGSLKWHYTTTEDVNNCVPIVDNRGYVHIISDKAVYYIVKPDGSLLSSAELGVKCLSSPVMDSNGYLYVGIEAVAGASDMVCISSGAKSYADSAWPMKGQNPQRTGLQK